ncbi:MAG: virulence RhuM family protein [Bacteroidales bacterium]|nr:virulence RhuM family protein [Bacteroidales bacterium]
MASLAHPINEHILNAYKEKEIEEEKTMRKIGNSDFSTKPTNYYNLDVIISVGYRVKSSQSPIACPNIVPLILSSTSILKHPSIY